MFRLGYGVHLLDAKVLPRRDVAFEIEAAVHINSKIGELANPGNENHN